MPGYSTTTPMNRQPAVGGYELYGAMGGGGAGMSPFHQGAGGSGYSPIPNMNAAASPGGYNAMNSPYQNPMGSMNTPGYGLYR